MPAQAAGNPIDTRSARVLGAHRVLLGEIEMAQDRLGVPVQHGASLGEQDPLGAARDQLPVELGLQARQVMAQRRLRNVQLIGGAREAARLDDADEVSQLAQIHDRLAVAWAVPAPVAYLALSTGCPFYTFPEHRQRRPGGFACLG